MRQHEIPRKKQSETKLFVIFSIRSLILTFVGIVIGLVFSLIPFLIFRNAWVTLAIIGVFGILGFVAGTLPITYIPFIPWTRSVQGMYVHQIIWKYMKFKSRRSLKMMNVKKES